MKSIEVCLTPELIHQHDLIGKVSVAIDIFRATSCMVTGMAHAVKAIYPVETVEECTALGQKGLVTAGERGGQKIEHFDIGNSPFDYMKDQWSGRDITVSTTNGTVAIKRLVGSDTILIGAFLNLGATVSYIQNQAKDVVLLCAGWKGAPNIEDTLYAGALVERLSETHQKSGDSSYLAQSLFSQYHSDTKEAAVLSSHAARMKKFGLDRDVEFCLKEDEYEVVVAYHKGKLVRI